MSTAGAGYVWAVDLALERLAFAFAPLDGGTIEVESLITASGARDGERLGLLDRQTRIYARQAEARYPPAVVWIEQPSGRHRNLALTYAAGVVQAAVFETLGVPVWTMPAPTWKRQAIGTGNATKAQVSEWVEAQGVSVGSQDEADAYAFAVVGRSMVLSGRWDAAAA